MSTTRSQRFVCHLSRHVATHELDADHYAIWNSFFPSPLVIDGRTLQILRDLPKSTNHLDRQGKRKLVRHRIIYRGSSDPYEKQFFASADAALSAAARYAEQFYAECRPYATLSLVNSGCNLGCSYCVSYAGDSFRVDAARVAERGDARSAVVMDVVDQFLQRRVRSGEREAKIFFNGGEILLRWSLIQRVLAHVKSMYPQVKVAYGMNTNATLITDEIAQKLNEFDIQIHVSIDGYKELHDSSRVHHGGAPSFERVMEGIANYNKHNPDRAVTTFQGTIEAVEDFDTSQFTAMADLGFVSAHLAPNVLNAAPGKGAVAATWEANVTLDTQRERVELDNTYLQKILGKMNQHPTGFSPHCGGLSGNLTSLTLNIDSLQVSQMCSFVSPAALPLSDLEYDIYNPRLWAETYKYMRSRIDMLRDECSGCSVLGHCQGACVYNGLDLSNKLNPEGCAYQRTMWHHALDLSFLGHLRPSGSIVEAHGREDGSDGHVRSKYIPLTPVP